MDINLNWITEKPDYACVVVCKNKNVELADYIVFRFAWEKGEGDGEWYLGWFTEERDEYDDYKECDYDEYLVLEILPTMEQTHKEWVESIVKW